jgi:EAL domain-containing protein (putative c-di-GMP-specific phosphodiesterase class I)
MREQILARRVIERQIVAALQNDQIEPFFQPIVDMTSGRTTGFEALARWPEAEGDEAAVRLVAIAESNGSIVEITEAVLNKACRAAADWADPLPLSVNLSALQFRDEKRLTRAIRDALNASGLPANRLCLEITETLLMDNPQQTRAAMRALEREGVQFALDDFGVGYSSLAYLHDFPFARIKIDSKFIQRIDTDNAAASIVAAVAFLARRLDLDIIAEGVETEAQALTLLSLGVTQAQGFRYGRPSPVARIAPFQTAQSA